MRNLKLLKYSATSCCKAILADALFLSVDQDTSDVYVATATSLSALSPLEKTSHEINLKDEGVEGPPIGLQYLCDQQSVCIATKDGQICLWEKGREQMECVGEVPQGLTSMAWSPDLELLVITTANNTLILMTREFDPITELPLFADHSAEETPVSVGWGKKETQFHGSAGKEAAKKTSESVRPIAEDDPGTISVRWRGDGQFFVVNAIDPGSSARFMYVWSRECIFQSKSEIVNGLQHLLDWKPSGSLIASVQAKGDSSQQDVIFYEKNGLRHGQFSVSCGQMKRPVVRKLMWNQDSTVLCLWLQDAAQPMSEVRLMTVNNYHWYLKQSLKYSHTLSVVEWDPEQPYKLFVGSSEGICTYSWTWDVCCTSGADEADSASVAVIDGEKLLVTPMRKMVVPPPMAAFTLTSPCQVNFATFDPSPGSNAVTALLADGTVAVFKYQESKEGSGAALDAAGGDGFTPKCDTPSLTNILTFDKNAHALAPLSRHHLLWIDKTKMSYVTTDESGEFSHVHIGELRLEENLIVDRYSMGVEELVIAVALSGDGKHVALQLASGAILKLDVETEIILPWEGSEGEVSFPYSCTTMAVAQIGQEEVVLGLTDKFRFYVNGIEVASNCTSFALHNDFLLLSTLSHTVRCIHRDTKVADLPKLSDGKDHPFDESVRRVERGSKIVTVVGNDTKLVLQMPRGNLETIHPRALVLSTLKKLLTSFDIKTAFSMMRKHRVNLNLFYDHNPESFVNNVDAFIEQIGSVTYLNLFITELVEEDITRTMYTASYQRDKEKKSTPTRSKVDLVCNTLLDAFKRLGEHKYFLSVLTTHVKKTIPEFEQALLKIWSLQGNDEKEGQCSASAALKYLLILVDVNTMYQVALGTYNFDLVMMVAQQSQKDPREYIPFLNELRRLEENYRCYTIDKHLKKYGSALEHISKCGDDHFEESVALVCEHKLYSKALTLYKTNQKHFQHFASLYGEYLKSKNRTDEAGVMFVKAEKWNQALECFRADYDWQQVFCMAARLKYTSNQTSELAHKVSDELRQRQRFSDAATILEQYAQNPEEAIVCLIEGSHWSEAMRMMHRYGHLDLIETHLLEALTNSFNQHRDLLNDQRELFDRHRNRLDTVRVEKEKKQRLLMEGISEYNDAEADLFSDTTSVTGASVSSHRTYDSSRSTVFSKATGKSRRKGGSTKKWSLKEGSANEEFALIEALAKIIKYIDGLKEETNHLLKALMQFNFDEKAVSLQEMYSDFLSMIQSAIPEIWTENVSSPNNANSLGPNTTANSIALAMQRQQKTPSEDVPKLDPVLRFPPTLNKDSRWKLHMAATGDLDR